MHTWKRETKIESIEIDHRKEPYKSSLIVSSKARSEEKMVYLIQEPVFNKQRYIKLLGFVNEGVWNGGTSMHAGKNTSISAGIDYFKAGLASPLVLKKLIRKTINCSVILTYSKYIHISFCIGIFLDHELPILYLHCKNNLINLSQGHVIPSRKSRVVWNEMKCCGYIWFWVPITIDVVGGFY